MPKPVRRPRRHASSEREAPGRRPAARADRAPHREVVAQRALITLAEAATSGLTPGKMLELVAAAAGALVGDATVHLWLVEEERGELRLVAQSGARPGRRRAAVRGLLRLDEGLPGAVARRGKPLVVLSLDGDRRLADVAWIRDQGFVSFAGVPFTRAGRLLGVLCLFTWTHHRFTRQEIELLRSFASHGAVALESAALLETATSRLRRLETLREIEREISQQHDPDELLGLIVRRATELLEADSATVFLLEERQERLRAHASFNAPALVRDVTLRLGEGVVGTIALRRKGMVVNDYGRSPHAIPPFRDLDAAVAGQPLLHGDHLRGVIVVRRVKAHRRAFSEVDLLHLGDFAVQASIALENARLFRLASARAERVKAAAEVGQVLVATLDADRILEVIAEKCRDMLDANAFALFRFGADGRLHYVRGFGLDESVMRAQSLGLGEGVVGRAALERRPIETTDVLRDPALQLDPATRARVVAAGSRALVAVPIVIRAEILGVVAVYHPVGFRIPAEEREFLETLANHAAAALDNARLFEQIRRRQETAETLAALTQILTGTLDLPTVLSLVADGIRRLLGSDGGAIGLVEADGAIRLAVAVGLGAAAFRDSGIRPGQGVGGRVLETGQPFWTSDYLHDPRISRTFAEQVRTAGIAGELAVPVRLREETVGVLWAIYGRPVDIGDDDVSLATDLAHVVAVAVENARLYQQARQREAEARAVFEVGRLISATLEADRVLDLIVEKVMGLLGVPACGLFRLEAGGGLRYVRGAGLTAEYIAALRIAMGEGASGRSVAERTPVWTTNILTDPAVALTPATRALVEKEGFRAVLSVPIWLMDAPYGALAVYWWEPHQPTAGEIGTLSSLATFAAVALENARLYGEAQRHEAEAVALAEASRRCGATLRREAIVDIVVETASRMLGGSWAVLLVRPGSSDVRPVASRPDDASERAGLALLWKAIAQGPAAEVASGRTPLLVPDIVDLPADEPTGRLSQSGARSLLVVPIMTGGTARGVLAGVATDDDHRFTERHLGLAQAVADRAAIALENVRLFEELTRAYQDLKTAQEHLVQTEKLRALGEMASGVAHDFNNVLAAILGRVQLILSHVEEPILRRWLEVIERAALDGAQTVRQIQEFTRIRRDQPADHVDVNRIVRDAVEMTQTRWRDQAQSQGLNVRMAVELGTIPPVEGHPAELRQVLTNLILNAVDALPAGGTITITTRPAPGGVEVAVADTGVGMSDEVRRRIFEPFFSTKGPSGTGLGLAMVYGIVSRHGGQIVVDSKEGAGATFTLHLPAASPAVPAGGAAAAAPAPGTRLRVLVIDDELPVREALADMLRLKHHDVVVAADGAEGLARFQEAPVDLVMTDLAMPGMSGWQVAQAVKALRPEVPVVLVTGWGMELSADQLQANGVDRVMTKPFKIDDVQEIVAMVRGRGRRRKEKPRPRRRQEIDR